MMLNKTEQLKLLCKDTTLREMIRRADDRKTSPEEALQKGILGYVGVKGKLQGRFILKNIDSEADGVMWVVEFWWV